MDEQNTNIPQEAEATDTDASVKNETTTSTSTTDVTGPAKSSGLLIAVVLGVALVVVAGLYYYYQNREVDNVPVASSVTPATATEYPDVVAVVNGEDVTSSDFVLSVNQVTQTATQQGADPSDPAVKAQIEGQAMDVLINTVLLRQAADASGITVTPEQIDAELSNITAQYESPEAFDAALTEFGLSNEDVRSDLEEKLVIDQYLQSNDAVAAVTVSDAEVQDMYDTLSAQGTGLPSLEEIRQPLEEQLLAQKQQQLISDVINGLREAAEIDIKL